MSQIDLLDLPLPPSSKASLPAVEHHLSKGPPPLPPSPVAAPDLVLPPNVAKTVDASDDLPVPSLALPEHSISRPSYPSHPSHATSPAAISARKLVDGPPTKEKSSVVRFLLGMGAASLVCVAIFFAYRTFHKTTPVPSLNATATATATSTAPHAFTMAPIEFTASSSDEPSATASAPAPPPTTTTTARSTGNATTAAPRPTQTGGTKPPRTDEVIKVEN